MKQMNGLDRMFINVETARLPMDMFGILMLDPSTAPDGHDFARFRTEMAARLPKIPVFTRRAVSAPFGAGHEHWIVDPNFTIDRHLKHLGAPAPYDLSALCDLAVSLADEPLDRSRPLWQMYYVDGLADGSAAILLRLHHAAIDGVGGTEMLSELFDTTPLPMDPDLAAHQVNGERVPSQAEMLLRSVPGQMLTPVKLARRSVPIAIPLLKGLVSRASSAGRSATKPGVDEPSPPEKRAPTGPSPAASRNLLNRLTSSPKRSVAVTSLSMSEVKRAKDRFGVTLNDVVLSITSAAVADYLRDRDELPGEPLRIAGPVNIRDEAAESASGNHFAFMMVPIPDIADPVERIRTVSALTAKRKAPASSRATARRTSRKPTGTVSQVMGLIDALPSGAWLALGQLVNSPAVEAVPPVANFVVSNIPGPRDKLYIAGAEITHMYGRTMVGAGIGLFIHCLSYGDSLDFGFTALGDLVPDPETIVEGVHRHLSELLNASAQGSDQRTGLAALSETNAAVAQRNKVKS
ncbi:wax ester/triacylglycerol synthase family O-acyltransferase [Mycobacterium helveticum]|uniref:Diacylglycerol O-acyltransferase n=2 Tax=Mycobacterium helveticum TaxID=2592811 RepID=A0A557Y0P6_9MYCO|nr:wax ester/triacylglycerol synthase family O-acyltransferase [Mycobacterium helveticum]TVS92149.1 wax ester/triacylglycerol synthase family O-acyltransferase [Mycobacterium helveticum]